MCVVCHHNIIPTLAHFLSSYFSLFILNPLLAVGGKQNKARLKGINSSHQSGNK